MIPKLIEIQERKNPLKMLIQLLELKQFPLESQNQESSR